MADNLAFTPGSGATIATDDVAGAHYQRIKLHSAEDGTADPIGDDDYGASRALWVANRRNIVTSQQNSAGLTTSVTNYSAGDVLGTGWTFTGAARATGGTGRVRCATLLDVADKITAVTIYLASAAITFGTDNAAPSVSDADAAKIVGSIVLPSAADLGGARLATLYNLDVPYVCDATSLFVYAVDVTGVAAFFGAATDLKLRLFLELD